MRRFIFVLLLSAVIGFAQDPARMDEAAKAQAANDKFMGSVLVARDGTVIFAQSYGWANVEWRIPNTGATKFRLGSLTKQFTAAAILLLQEEGKLALDDPLSRFIPSAPDTWKGVTIQQLLTHTSGIPSFTDFPEYETHKREPDGPAQTMAYIRDRPLEFPPGEKFKYSNTGFVLLGWIVEVASGQSYPTFVREHIFEPLGMNDSGYDSNSAIIPQRAAGYVPGRHGLINAPYIDMHVPGAAGALYSTTPDLLRWTQGLFGGKLLKPASLERMITPVKSGYAFGLAVTSSHGRKLIAHNGGVDGFNSHLAYFPESKTTVVVLSNVAGPAFAKLAGQLEALAFGEAVIIPAERKEVEVPATILQQYVGTYELRPGFDLVITLEDGQLMSQATGQGKAALFPEAETKFFLNVVDAQIEFFTDGNGAVTHLVLHQGGQDHKAARKR
jgi:CubicO group peptidase (beta-lactamase class C family)